MRPYRYPLRAGVFDGHGPNGHHASNYVKEKLPKAWAESVGDLSVDPLLAMSRGCLSTNEQLSVSHIDVYVSGSTGISSLLRGNRLFVANVGDSRAVLGRATAPAGSSLTASTSTDTQTPGGANGSAGSGRASLLNIRALDLSSDQKPDRPDEHARIMARGGRVFEWGVPRVWLAEVDMPGLAMSRSFGDAAAESVGVFAEPELSEVTLGANDRLIIWATDGVWE